MSIKKCPICSRACELKYICDFGNYKTLNCMYTCSLIIDEKLLLKSIENEKKLNMVFQTSSLTGITSHKDVITISTRKAQKDK